MECDVGKLFIGGISWDTDEERLRDYFCQFGEVVEAIIMKDRATSRGRGFGFIIFADPSVAEQVLSEKHAIDGRMVEAKKAVPRDDRNSTGREGSTSVHGSPGAGRTKKIFVGGLPSTLLESEFKKYFDQFGTITDVVVMHDHNTQRPRGFGFITYDSEDAVDNVLVRTFHELNGKMVEVKRAVPKEQSPGASMNSISGGYNYVLNSPNSILSGYNHGQNPSLINGYGMGVDGGLRALSNGRNGLPSFNHSGFGMGINLEPRLGPNFGGNSSLNYNLSYGRASSPFYSANLSRYGSAMGYGGGIGNNSSLFNSVARTIWGNGSNNGLNYGANLSSPDAYMATGTSSSFGIANLNWGSSMSSSAGGIGSRYVSGNVAHADGENFGFGGSNLGMNGRSGASNIPLVSSSGELEAPYENLYGGGSLYGDPTWRSSSAELKNAGPFSYGLDDMSSDIPRRSSTGDMGGYDITDNEANKER